MLDDRRGVRSRGAGHTRHLRRALPPRRGDAAPPLTPTRTRSGARPTTRLRSDAVRLRERWHRADAVPSVGARPPCRHRRSPRRARALPGRIARPAPRRLARDGERTSTARASRRSGATSRAFSRPEPTQRRCRRARPGCHVTRAARSPWRARPDRQGASRRRRSGTPRPAWSQPDSAIALPTRGNLHFGSRVRRGTWLVPVSGAT